ncbi:helix-turn-helix domain-containing protein [Salmonella enterica]|nr:DNA-binding protein [Salmonella enterica subsp. enterica serovar Paratyphi B]EKJ5541481.1 helix-turn-helix domain-containing protein [Salmonella enterica]
MTRNEVAEDWHPGIIVGRIREKGLTLRALSLAAGLGKDTVKNSLYRKWPKGDKIIADALGVSPAEIWPSRYARKVE